MPDRRRLWPERYCLHIVPLWLEPPERREALCRAFEQEVYRTCFDNPDQMEDTATWLPLMQENLPTEKPRVFIIAACLSQTASGGRIIGGVVFEHYSCGDWLATYLAIRPEHRRSGLGRMLFDSMLRTIEAHAGQTSWDLYAEAERPDCVTPERLAEANARLQALAALGFRRVPIAYVQPKLAPDKESASDLMLLWYAGRSEDEAPGPERTRLAAFLQCFYAALDQPAASSLRLMLNESSANTPKIATEPLGAAHT
ncbi:MAG: GNAT family N-acetyltransferase [Acetobacteraceae bacterium]|nr:GNAT family N-acetyltransferase [Acetobacteraceae bacterium]